ncbi:MAG TPA: LysR family transcriptional regulator [Gammaproteobacteria bacterium]|nr:LysR family transcriptional regulator [Gammaproteobacteria bacterium]
MHLTLRQLALFEAVARHASISRAAEEVHLTQPAVSMQVKQLEDQVGLPLLERIGKRLHLTEAGHEVRSHAARIAAQVADLEAAIARLRGLEHGQLRLAVVATANYFISRLLARFSQSHPGVRISLQVGNSAQVLAALVENRSDLIITGQPPDDEDVIAQHFMDNPLVVIAAATHPLAAASSIPLERLGNEALVVRESGSGTREAVERHFAEHHVAYHTGCELSSNEAIKQAVQAGLGLGVVSAQTLELELATSRLAVLPVESFPILRHWYVVHRRHTRLAPAADALRSRLLSHDRSATRLSEG